MTGGQDVQQAQSRKKIAQEIMSDATFELHKWHCNHPELEDRHKPEDRAQLLLATEEQFYAKQQLRVQPSDSKLLGIKWNKTEDTIAFLHVL